MSPVHFELCIVTEKQRYNKYRITETEGAPTRFGRDMVKRAYIMMAILYFHESEKRMMQYKRESETDFVRNI